MSKEKACKYISVGGQALMEGILMRGPQRDCIALRLPNGTIELKNTDKPDKKKPLWSKIPILRGMIAFVLNMIVGYKALMYSAERTGMLDELEEEEPSKFEKWMEKHVGASLMAVVGVISMVLGLALSLLLFKFLPTLAVGGLARLGLDFGNSVVKSVIEGLIKMAIFIGYIASVSFMKEIRTTFMYHGAEHKSITCFEAGDELTPENARKHSRLHPRCGTSFIFITLFVGIIVNSFISWDSLPARMGMSLALLPLVMGVCYELVVKICGRYDNIITRIISTPGKWVQLLTTKEPTDQQLEVAIAALKEVLPSDGTAPAMVCDVTENE